MVSFNLEIPVFQVWEIFLNYLIVLIFYFLNKFQELKE